MIVDPDNPKFKLVFEAMCNHGAFFSK